MAEGDLHRKPEESFDASDPEQVKKREAAQGLKDFEQRKFLKELLTNPIARAWIWDLLTDANVFSTTFDRDPIQMAFNEGKRNFGTKLWIKLERISPEMLVDMIRENGGK